MNQITPPPPPPRPVSTQVLALVGWLLLCFIAAGIGAKASVDATPFYKMLIRPSWAPPAWLFGPVWSVLYASMGVAAWLVWRAGANKAATSLALGFFVAQLAANSLWSWLFFGWHQGGWALAEIGLLWVLIVGTMFTFWRVKPLAGLILIPYLIWVSFAAVLNGFIWYANRGAWG
jgi:translocator protein